MKISASIFNCSYLHMKEELDALVAGGVDMFHIDLMDGHYVPNLCFPVNVIAELKMAYPQVQMDVHVMVDNPVSYIERIADTGADYMSFHTDSTNVSRRLISQIREFGMKPGIVVNPSQRVDHILPLAKYVDMVTMMTVEPGFAGQSFLSDGMERLQELVDLRKECNADFLINVDGGVSTAMCPQCKEIGVDLIIGTVWTIFKQPCGIEEACKKFYRDFG